MTHASLTMSACAECVPGAGPPTMTSEDYQRALDLLATREDLTQAQRDTATQALKQLHDKHQGDK